MQWFILQLNPRRELHYTCCIPLAMCFSFTSRSLARRLRSTVRPGPASFANRAHSTSLSNHSIVSLQLLSHTYRPSISTTSRPSTSIPVALPSFIMSTTGLGDAQAEPEVTVTASRLAEKRSRDAIRARIDRITRQRQSRQRCKLSDEELVLLALAYSSDQWLMTAQIGEFGISRSRFYQKQAARSLFGRTSLPASPQSIGSLPSRIER